MYFLAEKSLEGHAQDLCTRSGSVMVHGGWELLLPSAEQGFTEAAPNSIEHGCLGDWSFFCAVLWQHYHHVHLLLGGVWLVSPSLERA